MNILYMEQYAFHTFSVSLLTSLHGYLFATTVATGFTQAASTSAVFILTVAMKTMKNTGAVVVCLFWFRFSVPLGVVWLLLPSWLKMNQ